MPSLASSPDQDVNGSELGLDVVDQGAGGLEVGRVVHEAPGADLDRRRPDALRRARGDGNAGALGDQLGSNRPANPAGSTGDQRHPIGEPEVHAAS